MNQQIVRFITLRKTNYREADLIIQGLAAEGFYECIALGAKNSRKRFAGGVLEPIQYIKAKIVKIKAEQTLWRVEEARVIDHFAGLRQHFSRLDAALRLARWTSQLCRYQTHHEELFLTLGRALRHLEQIPLPFIGYVHVHFLCRYLLIEGCLDAQDPLWLWSQNPSDPKLTREFTADAAKERLFRLYAEHLGLHLCS